MTSLLQVLIIASVVSAALTIAGDCIQPRRVRLVYICKPLATILILVIALLAGTFARQAYTRAIAVGLTFSLMGDIWLMLPRDRFLYGLASFLVAHVCYAFAFAAGALAPAFAWAALALMLVGIGMMLYLWRGIPSAMRPAVIVYIAAILAMAALALGRASLSPTTPALLAAVGALLFVISDAALAINRFRIRFRLAQAVILGTYFSAQLLIALSTLQH